VDPNRRKELSPIFVSDRMVALHITAGDFVVKDVTFLTGNPALQTPPFVKIGRREKYVHLPCPITEIRSLPRLVDPG